ncbi:hypothetical protein LTR70_010206 [Exophiala xenobiotica]|uniref:Uncharacterized protein n=1 Tax=Lithohypha guttulata TaxID=1690604 RepID=A0ABR0JWA4_9EURO|nr:hypothetical protein LTR24_010256 [Lithohypha guttulata]KAK5309529.1 hypothetical protein LTR70_010206 [Exophiala xenobiotica]
MPPLPGEERLVTVFADIHYYFAQPTIRPLLQRFDKASYFYIYYNSTRHSSRIEIANNPGTPDQDAFNGYIDTCRITNSYKFPTLLTIEVDGVPTSPTSPKGGRDSEEWRLASADPRDANRSKYRLHTLDVYFWAQEDARLVIECFKKLLPPSQLDVAELESEEPYHEPTKQDQPATAMSPMVQNLENLAVTDQYNGQQQQTGASPTSSFASHNVPPPPPAGSMRQQIHSPSPAISDLSSQHGRQTSVRSNPQSTDFTPMAYNPAAPAAPEPIAHREKTPPPEDGTGGTGLSQAARHDQGYTPGAPSQGGYQPGQGVPVSFGGGYASPPPQQSGYTSPPPHQQGYISLPPQGQGYTSPLPGSNSGVHTPHTFHGAATSTGLRGQPPSSTTGYQSPYPQSNYSHQDQRSSMTSTAPSFGPGASSTAAQGHDYSTAAEQYVPHQAGSQQPVVTPGSQFYESLGQPSKPLAHVRPQYADYLSSSSTPVQSQYTPANPSPNPPIGGYSQYNYGQGQGQTHNQYDVHQQLYRPTEAEAGTHHHKKPSRSSTTDNRKPSTADKVEKRVGSLFKRIEKRIG